MNNKRVRILGSLAIIVVAATSTGAWIWSLGSVKIDPPRDISLDIISGDVEIKSGDAWIQAKDGQKMVQGDTLKTANGADAQIIWGDLGVTRLDPGTELTIEKLPSDINQGSKTVIGLKLQSGRIWNRMLKLLDIDSSMEIKTNDIVATVRGTTYGIAKLENCTEAIVSESAVAVMNNEFSEVILTDNQKAVFGLNDCTQPAQRLSSEDAWFQQQFAKDKNLDLETAKQIRMRADLQARSAPIGLIELAERVHLELTDDEAQQELALSYAKRRIGWLIQDQANTEAQIASIRRLLPYMGKKANQLKIDLNLLVTMLSRLRQTGMQNQAESFLSKQLAKDEIIEDLRLLRDAADVTGVDQIFQELIQIDEAVGDFVSGVMPPEGRANFLGKILTRLDAVDNRIAQKNDNRYLKKSQAIRMRLLKALESSRPEPVVEINPSEKPEITINEPTLQNPVIKAPTKNTATQPPQTQPTQPTQAQPAISQPVRTYEVLSLSPSPISSIGGQTVTLKLFGTKADGVTDELTAQAAFSLARSTDGTLQRNILTPSFLGSIVVNAAFVDAQGSRSVSATIFHSAPRISNELQSIEIRFTGPTTVTCSASLPYKIIATYGDKTTNDVTISTKISVSDPKLLYPGDQKILTFCSGVQSSGVVTGAYTENGMTKSVQATITVIPDPATPSAPASSPTANPYYQYLY